MIKDITQSAASGSLSLLRLLQLTSSNLPVGGFTFSQGLEYAIDAAWVETPGQVRDWIEQSSVTTLVYTDLPILARQYRCIQAQDWQAFVHWNDMALAVRETAELRLADVAMGEALLRLAKSMGVTLPESCAQSEKEHSFISLFALVACHMGIPYSEAGPGYSWMVIENQVLGATKLLPMGQTAAQLMLIDLSETVRDCISQADAIEDSAVGLGLPGLAMASALHETQYSRLYRS